MNPNKYFSINIFKLLLILSVCFLASCKNEEVEDDIWYTLTLNAGQPSDDGCEITAGTTWSSSDKIALINLSGTREITNLTNSGSTFTGTTLNLSNGYALGFLYPSDALTTAHSDTTTQVFYMSKQDGTPNTVLKYKYGYVSSVTPSGTNCSTSVTMNSVLAEADMKFLCNGAPIQNITKLEFRAKEGEVYGERTYNFRKKDYEKGTNNNMVIKNSKGLDGSATLAFIPTDNVLLEVSVFTADGQIYIGTNNEETSIEKGKYYSWTFECQKENGIAHIGDYFYSDMTVSSDYNENKTCIGIVFALADTEDGPINKSLTASPHGRIVALKDVAETGKCWATLIYNIVGMPDYTTADGKLEEGFLPFSDGKSKNSYFDEGHIEATITEDGRIDSWPNSGLLSDFNGKENTAYADSSSIIYAACGSAAKYAIKGISNKRFYCPAGGEMALLYELYQTGLISAATKQKFTDFEKRGYWVSAERESNRAWYIQFATGGVYSNYKMSSYWIRPAMHF